MAKNSYEHANFGAERQSQTQQDEIEANFKTIVMAVGFVSLVGLVSLVAGGAHGLPVYVLTAVAICSGIALMFWD